MIYKSQKIIEKNYFHNNKMYIVEFLGFSVYMVLGNLILLYFVSDLFTYEIRKCDIVGIITNYDCLSDSKTYFTNDNGPRFSECSPADIDETQNDIVCYCNIKTNHCTLKYEEWTYFNDIIPVILFFNYILWNLYDIIKNLGNTETDKDSKKQNEKFYV